MKDSNTRIIVLMGGPGSGKGTQAKKLIEKYDLAYLATGDIVREVARSTDPNDTFASEFKKRMNAGIPQPDDAILMLVRRKLETMTPDKGIIFDAFPLSVPQAEGLAEIVDEKGWADPVALFIEVTKEEVVKRLSLRRACESCHTPSLPGDDGYDEEACRKCGRKLITREDDTPEVVAKRYDEYVGRIEGMARFYTERNALLTVRGEQTIDKVFADMTNELDKYWNTHSSP